MIENQDKIHCIDFPKIQKDLENIFISNVTDC